MTERPAKELPGSERDGSITYKCRLYKYTLQHDWSGTTETRPPDGRVAVEGDWVVLEADGTLSFREGYMWDGPSGPTIDTRTFMRGSLVHDGLYQLLREGLLGEPGGRTWKRYRKLADVEMKIWTQRDGMNFLRRAWVYRALRWFGGKAARPAERPSIGTAP